MILILMKNALAIGSFLYSKTFDPKLNEQTLKWKYAEKVL